MLRIKALPTGTKTLVASSGHAIAIAYGYIIGCWQGEGDDATLLKLLYFYSDAIISAACKCEGTKGKKLIYFHTCFISALML